MATSNYFPTPFKLSILKGKRISLCLNYQSQETLNGAAWFHAQTWASHCGPGDRGNVDWPIWVTGMSYGRIETLQLTASPGPQRMKEESPGGKKKTGNRQLKNYCYQRGTFKLSPLNLLLFNQKPVTESLGYVLNFHRPIACSRGEDSIPDGL